MQVDLFYETYEESAANGVKKYTSMCLKACAPQSKKENRRP